MRSYWSLGFSGRYVCGSWFSLCRIPLCEYATVDIPILQLMGNCAVSSLGLFGEMLYGHVCTHVLVNTYLHVCWVCKLLCEVFCFLSLQWPLASAPAS